MDIQKYLKEHETKELVRFITCGSVDDGKSTLIGRLLYDSKVLFEDQLDAAKSATKKYGSVNSDIDFALLIDGLQSEHEQGITIDVAYRFFSTEKRKYIIADTPGHEQYTRNTVTGASTSDLAVILIDARKSVLTQTRRHSFLVSLLGIRNVLVAINKMDLVGYSEERYRNIVRDYKKMYSKLRQSLPYKTFQQNIDFIPISALKGDNVVDASNEMPWYRGMSLISYLDNVVIEKPEFDALRFPVQYVNRPNLDFRGYAGTISSGNVSVGDNVTVFPSRQVSTIKEIIAPCNPELSSESSLSHAHEAMAVTLTLGNELDIAKGSLIIKSEDSSPYVNDTFEAMIVWMDEEALNNRNYIFKIYTKETTASIGKILLKKDVNTWEKIDAKTLNMNDIARVRIDVDETIAFDLYEENRETGAFILIDRITNNTVAAGMIVGVSTHTKKKKIYTPSEIALNLFVREQFPEWKCLDINDIED